MINDDRKTCIRSKSNFFSNLIYNQTFPKAKSEAITTIPFTEGSSLETLPWIYKTFLAGLPRGPVVKILHFCCRGHGLAPLVREPALHCVLAELLQSCLIPR